MPVSVGEPLTLEDVVAVARGAHVMFADPARERVRAAREVVERAVDGGEVAGHHLLGAVERVEIGGNLDFGIAAQRRILRHLLIDLDRELRLLDLLINLGEREQCQPRPQPDV